MVFIAKQTWKTTHCIDSYPLTFHKSRSDDGSHCSVQGTLSFDGHCGYQERRMTNAFSSQFVTQNISIYVSPKSCCREINMSRIRALVEGCLRIENWCAKPNAQSPRCMADLPGAISILPLRNTREYKRFVVLSFIDSRLPNVSLSSQ